ncbi:LacI family DNA-binding transcriptional regulator [soil metagenome]
MGHEEANAVKNGFRDVASALQSRIAHSEIEAGAFLPTERDLQGEFGVGRSTVRKALSELVDRGWAQNVPNKGFVAGRGLRPVANGRIALVENGTFVQHALGASLEAMLARDGRSLIHVGGTLRYPMPYALQRVLDEEFEGAIIWCFDAFPDPDLVNQVSRSIPVVAVDHRMGNADTDLVTFDHEGAAYDATQALLRQGARRIGVTGMLDSLDLTHARFRGYQHAMFDSGISPDPSNFIFFNSDPDTTNLLTSRLRAYSPPHALLVLQDVYVPTVIECALRAGLSLPGDLRLATIGDETDVTVDGVGLTAVALDWDALAVEAFRLLSERLGDLHRSPQVRTVPHRLVVRGLCGAPSSEWTPEPQTVTGFRGESPIPRPIYRYRSSWSVQHEP